VGSGWLCLSLLVSLAEYPAMKNNHDRLVSVSSVAYNDSLGSEYINVVWM
jgi:hypothetical protein